MLGVMLWSFFFYSLQILIKLKFCNYPVIIKSCNVSPWSWMNSVYLINFKVYHDKEECIIYRVVTSARPCNKSVTCFDLQFWRSTRPMMSFCIFIAYIKRGNSFQRQNYKMRSLNWINSMQVKKILFTNVFPPWSLCLLNMFPSMVFPKHLYLSGLLM